MTREKLICKNCNSDDVEVKYGEDKRYPDDYLIRCKECNNWEEGNGEMHSFEIKESEKIYFAKVKENAVIPTKESEDGCYDIYTCFDEDEIVIKSGEIKLVPTGIASAFSEKYRIGLRERGSTGTNGLAVRAGQIDSGYRGEWFVPINNTTNKTIVISKLVDRVIVKNSSIFYPYKKAICQGALEEVPVVSVEEINYEDLKKIESIRGIGKLGSSNK